MNKSDDNDDDDEHENIFTKKITFKKIATYYNSQKNEYGFEQNLDLHHEICVVVESRGSTASFGRQRVVGGRRSDHLFVKVLNLLFVHLHHNRPLQLHGRACWVQSVSLLDSWFHGHTNGMKRKKKNKIFTHPALLQWWRSLGQGWSTSGCAGHWRWTSCWQHWFPPGWQSGRPGLCRLQSPTLEWPCCPTSGRTPRRLASARPLALRSQGSPYTVEGQIKKKPKKNNLILDVRS